MIVEIKFYWKGTNVKFSSNGMNQQLYNRHEEDFFFLEFIQFIIFI